MAKIPDELSKRHPATLQVFRFFAFDHLPDGALKLTSERCYWFAYNMVLTLPDGPQLTIGLQKLLEAKECFMRSALDITYAPQWPSVQPFNSEVDTTHG